MDNKEYYLFEINAIKAELEKAVEQLNAAQQQIFDLAARNKALEDEIKRMPEDYSESEDDEELPIQEGFRDLYEVMMEVERREREELEKIEKAKEAERAREAAEAAEAKILDAPTEQLAASPSEAKRAKEALGEPVTESIETESSEDAEPIEFLSASSVETEEKPKKPRVSAIKSLASLKKDDDEDDEDEYDDFDDDDDEEDDDEDALTFLSGAPKSNWPEIDDDEDD